MQTVTSTLAVLCLILGLSGVQANVTPEQRSLFKIAYQAAQQGNFTEMNTYSVALKNYPLFPWIEYEYLKQNFATVSGESIIAFTSRHPNSLMSDVLYERLAAKLASSGDWAGVLSALPVVHPNESIQCYRVLALHNLGRSAEGNALGQAIVEPNPAAMPTPCIEVIGLLYQAQLIDSAKLWQRIEKALNANQITFTQAVAKLLPTEQQLQVERWIAVRQSPKAEVTKLLSEPDTPERRDLIVFGLRRMAQKEWTTASSLWHQAQGQLSFSPSQQAKVNSELGLWEAFRHKPEALAQLRAIPDAYRTDEASLWMIRSALRQNAWDDVLKAILSLSPEIAGESEWRYWHARALQAKGQPEQARQLLASLAADVTFYGLLAADHLGVDYQRLKDTPPDRSQRVAGIKRLAAVARWQEWLVLGERGKARQEWFRLLKAMDKIGVQAAAQFATQSGDSNLAIWTASRTKDWNAVDVRFPLEFEDLVMNSAQAQGVNPAWVLGVIRRESAFDQSARSSVNALGLMQLMPATARDVGKRLGVTLNANDDILHPPTNVELGSAYLKDMLQRFGGDYVRATAAYNAGPGRIPKWKPERTLPADQWIESIPFEETRDYVKAVMSYTTIYDAKLHQSGSMRLSERFKPIVD